MYTSVRLETSWKQRLESEFSKAYMQDLRTFLKAELRAGKTIYPQPHQYFSALNLTPFSQVRVVILGQDPYHGERQAHGLCFSVAPDVRIPPSLVNIYQEIQQDLGVSMPSHGCLIHWAQQGVLLLNSVLTVEQGKAASHQKKGWEQFTDKVIATINAEKEHVVFILWGAYAQKKGAFIDRGKHLVIEGLHPSPLSAHRGFFGQHYFSRANDYLAQHQQQPVDWLLPDKAFAKQAFLQAESINQRIFKGE
jgi:uracil-DNA glycosylase